MDAAKPSKPLKKPTIPKDALRVGPFVLTKGRGKRWHLKGVKGVRFNVEPFTFGETKFYAHLTISPPGFNESSSGLTPEEAARTVLDYYRRMRRVELQEFRRELRVTQQDINHRERVLEILRTGKVPVIRHDKAHKPRRKR